METTKKFCTNCGAPLKPGQGFCAKCGHKVAEVAQPSSNASQPAATSTKSNNEPGTVQKLKDAAISSTNNLADAASKKTGKQVKPSWIVGGIGAIIVLAVVIFMLIPKGLNGSYSHTTTFLGTSTTDTWVFKGKDVTEKGTGNKGTYKVSGDNLEIDLNGQKMTATLSDDKKSFTIDSAPGLAALANGTKYTKVEQWWSIK